MSNLPHLEVSLVQYIVNNQIIDSKIAKLSAMIDTGSTISVINRSIVNKYKLKTNKHEKIRISNAVSSLNITTDDIIKCNVKFNNIELVNKIIYIVNDLQTSLILGMDMLKGLTIELSKNPTLKLQEKLNNLTGEKLKSHSLNHVVVNSVNEFHEITEGDNTLIEGSTKIITWEEKIINPYAFCFISVRYSNENSKPKTFKNEAYISIHKNIADQGLDITPKIGCSNSKIYVLNNTQQTIYLPKNTEIGILRTEYEGEKLYDYRNIAEIHERNILQTNIQNKITNKVNKKHELNVLTEICEFSEKDRKQHDEEYHNWKKFRAELCKTIDIQNEIDRIISQTNDKYKVSISDMLNKNNESFARSDQDNGFSIKYGIRLIPSDLKDPNPRYSPPYKIDNDLSSKLTEQIDKFIEAGIMETCASPFNSPILCVRKKATGKIRIVSNYATRDGVNSKLLITKTPVIPTRLLMAKIGFAIKNLEQKFPNEKILFSSIDVKNAYYSLSIANSDRNITSFILSNRQIRYQRLVQGLSLAPSCWNQFMNKSFSDGPQDNGNWELAAYMDDLLCIAPESKMAEAIEKTFLKIKEANLIISIQKCMFYQEEVAYLGYIIDSKQIKISQDRTKILEETEFPKNHKEAMKYCGIFNYFIRQCPRIQHCLAPLQKEIGEGKKNFKMNEIILEGLKKLKRHIKSGIGQYHIDYNLDNHKIIFIATDASLTGWGACIGNAKFQNGEISRITCSGYASGKFDVALACQSARHRETVAAAKGLDSFKDMIQPDLEFYILTDHKSLENVKTNESLGKTITSTRVRKALGTLLQYPLLKIYWISNKSDIIAVVDGLSRDNKFKIFPTKENLEQIAQREIYDSEQVNMTYPLKTQTPTISLETVKKEQLNDEMGKILTEKLENSTSIPQRIGFNGKYYQFSNQKVILMENNKQVLLTWIPKNIAREVIEIVHVRSCHSGIQKINESLMSMNIYIPDKTRIVQEICSRCIYCQFTSKRRQAEIETRIKPGFQPFSEISADLISLEGYDSKSNKFLLTFLCKFTLYLDGELLRNKEMNTVAPAFIKLIHKYQLYGTSVIQTDNGLEFRNKMVDNLFEKLSISHSTISAHNSRGARVEQTHSQIRRYLRALETDDKNLALHANLAISSYNAAPNKGLNYISPFEALFGLKPRSPLIFLQESAKPILDEIGNDELHLHQSKWTEIIMQHHRLLGNEKLEYYVSSTKTSESYFEPGEIVICFLPSLRIAKTKANSATGPYEVKERKVTSYTLIHILSGNKITRNHRFLRRLNMTQKLREAIKAGNVALINDNVIRSIEFSSQDGQEDIKAVEFDTTVSVDNKVEKYNLRKRKNLKK